MKRAYKFRIYPDSIQQEKIRGHIGASNFIFNCCLEYKTFMWEKYKKRLSAFNLMKEITGLKKEPGFEWLQDYLAQSLQLAAENLDRSFQNFYRTKKYPYFKSKKNQKQSYQFSQGLKIYKNQDEVFIPKIGKIKTVFSRSIIGEIKRVTISKNSLNEFYISICVDDKKFSPSKPEIKNTIGIDVGIKDYAVLSTGEKIQNPKFLKTSIRKLQHFSRNLSRKKKQSKNYIKAKIRLAKVHNHVKNQRIDFIHKLTHKLSCENQADTFCVENLNVSGMIQNKKLSRSIADVSWSEFRRQLNYKCDWYGKNLIIIDRFFPSSKLCSNCGEINSNLKLSDREWICGCGEVHDRDINAAKNIRSAGLVKVGAEATVSTINKDSLSDVVFDTSYEKSNNLTELVMV